MRGKGEKEDKGDKGDKGEELFRSVYATLQHLGLLCQFKFQF
jgi:hypothetical protein